MNNNIINFTAVRMRKVNMIVNTENKLKNNYYDIDKDTKLKIEEQVSRILKDKTDISSPYVDIIQLVKSDDFIVQTSAMDINTTGCLIVNDIDTVMDTNKHRLIVVNQHFKNDNNDENVELKKSRFITAHEYGHFKLHKIPGQPIYAHRDTYHRTDIAELEADYFARSILMPYRVFNIYAKAAKEISNGDRSNTIYLLSTIFKVTKDKTKKRLNDLEELQGE